MNAQQLIAAAEACQWVGSRLIDLPERKEQVLQAGVMCTLAATVLAELAQYLAKGVDPYEALLKTAAGELPLKPEAATLLKILTAKPGAGSPGGE